MLSYRGKTQDLFQLTAQVRKSDNYNSVVGTAFAIDYENAILITCRHVVESSDNGNCDIGSPVFIYFHQLQEKEEKLKAAFVYKKFEYYDDDIILIQLRNPPLPTGIAVGVIGEMKDSVGYSQPHRFRSFGFRELQEYEGLPAFGNIIDFTAVPKGRHLFCHPVQIESKNIDQGMSGAPVLDLERNLIVGIISETWEAQGSQKDRDTSFAVNNKALSIEPFNISLYHAYSLPLTKDAPLTCVNGSIDENLGNQVFPLKPKFYPIRPNLPRTWSGRETEIKNLNQCWKDASTGSVGLIGFGGVGKSSLAIKWVSNLIIDNSLSKPDGVFWWSFYENDNVDTFIESALAYLAGGEIIQRITNPIVRNEILGTLIAKGKRRYIFILDGLEGAQEKSGDSFGRLKSNELNQFLRFFTLPGHNSFCLSTSRIPIMDLLVYPSYTHFDIGGLSIKDGQELLSRNGVIADDNLTKQLVKKLDGHPLSLYLVSSYINERFSGNSEQLEALFTTTNEHLYSRLDSILEKYDEFLSEIEKKFLMIFSAFRLPVRREAFKYVFRSETKNLTINSRLVQMADEEFQAIIVRLLKLGLINHLNESNHYSIHPLVRSHYYKLLNQQPSQNKFIHGQIKKFYLTEKKNLPNKPNLDELTPMFEAIYHACQSDDFSEAYQLKEFVDDGKTYRLTYELSAYQTALSMSLDFFPNKDIAELPLLNDSTSQLRIINRVGFCYLNLGRLNEAVKVYKKKIEYAQTVENWHSTVIGFNNISDVYVSLGRLDDALSAAKKAIDFAKLDNNRDYYFSSLYREARARFLLGDIAGAKKIFQYVQNLELKENLEPSYIFSKRIAYYIDYLIKVGDYSEAKTIIRDNLQSSRLAGWPRPVSQCLRQLGELFAVDGENSLAEETLTESENLARTLSDRAILIEVLLSRGRIREKTKKFDLALESLNEALSLALKGNFRLYEIDIRVLLASIYMFLENKNNSRIEIIKASSLAGALKYYWGFEACRRFTKKHFS